MQLLAAIVLAKLLDPIVWIGGIAAGWFGRHSSTKFAMIVAATMLVDVGLLLAINGDVSELAAIVGAVFIAAIAGVTRAYALERA
jgi:hypothetical protein